ncbi:DUF2812 domain-containing protein [Neobacillus dielmonensis]|uniref:DUF2812 domain-containing protein n=1 Tax=Neobacillus dielmonensis TaxID=1347369 RepID=UPI0005A9206E|nr:DUF2812 domain-containing protein [Neobacillus dielmonensis]
MGETKYVPSGGLAFTEEQDMKKLSDYAKEGWILAGFAPLGYKLIKGTPQNLIYCVDYHKDVDEEYFSLFEAAGWAHICSQGNEIHIFSAPAGTTPIYSDKETLMEKYEREKRQMGKWAVPFLIATLVFFFLSGMLPKILGIVSMVLGLICFIVLIFSGLPYLAYLVKLNKLRKQ